MVHRDDPIVDRKLAYHYQVTMHMHAHAWLIVRYWRQQKTILVILYGGPGGRATKHCTTSGFLIEQCSDGPIPCSSNGAAVRFCDRSHSAIKRSSTSATALTSIDLFLGSNNGLYLGSNNGLFLRSNSGPFLRPTSQTYYGIYRWYLA